ncbi:hypothetical protein [Sphingobacterium sp.]|uniref:hypothetical protein n=1 Tax=Sphingobacterium sp. TaxID=341027 RepID=UPI0031D51DEA
MINEVQSEKIYYHPNWKRITIAILLVLIGIATLWVELAPFWGCISWLPLKLICILIGFWSLMNRKKAIRAKTDTRGFYFKRMPTRHTFKKAFADLDLLVFVPFVQIVDIRMTANLWKGTRLELETTQGREVLTTLNVLSKKEKQQIYQTIKRFGIANEAYTGRNRKD